MVILIVLYLVEKKGDFINNLNFLELGGIKLVEHSILIAGRTKLFKNIYLITDDKKAAQRLVLKYPYLKFILVKNTYDPFYLMIKKNTNKIKTFRKYLRFTTKLSI